MHRKMDRSERRLRLSSTNDSQCVSTRGIPTLSIYDGARVTGRRVERPGARFFVKSRDRSHSSHENHFRRRSRAPIVRPSSSLLPSFSSFRDPRVAKWSQDSDERDTAVQLLLHKTVSTALRAPHSNPRHGRRR